MGVWRDLTAKQHAHTMADTQVEGRGVTAAWFSRSQQSPINKKVQHDLLRASCHGHYWRRRRHGRNRRRKDAELLQYRLNE